MPGSNMMEWHALNQLLDLVTLHVDAPIREGRRYTATEIVGYTSPEKVEEQFVKKYTPIIPENYFEKFEELCRNINYFIGLLHDNPFTWKTKQVWYKRTYSCAIIKVNLQAGFGQVQITDILVRPCAEQCGFWKRLLNSIRQKIQDWQDLEALTVVLPLENNRNILSHLGFREVPMSSDMYVRGADLKRLPSWEPTQPQPTAAQLNDPDFVNRDLKVKPLQFDDTTAKAKRKKEKGKQAENEEDQELKKEKGKQAENEEDQEMKKVRKR
jgi:hypothetical protein